MRKIQGFLANVILHISKHKHKRWILLGMLVVPAMNIGLMFVVRSAGGDLGLIWLIYGFASGVMFSMAVKIIQVYGW
jgi:RsiW-degrading membrane proteinase PrsW (M82 family)